MCKLQKKKKCPQMVVFVKTVVQDGTDICINYFVSLYLIYPYI